MAYTDFSPVAGKSGQISFNGVTYTVSTTANSVEFYLSPFHFTRTYLNFNTNGGIPSNAIVTKVELIETKKTTTTQSGTNPDDWKTQINIGTWIGAALDSSDWNGGTACATIDWATKPTTFTQDLGTTGITNYNNSGDTDISLTDSSDFTAGNGNWGNSYIEDGFKLRVHWKIPQII